MKNVQVEVGTRGIRPVSAAPEINIEENSSTSALIQQALNGEGELFYNKSKPNDWIIVKNIPALLNNNQEVTREALRIDIKFVDSLYLLREDDEYKDMKRKKLTSLPLYGTLIRPYAEITRETKLKAQQEAIKTLAGMDSDSLKSVLAQLNANVSALTNTVKVDPPKAS